MEQENMQETSKCRAIIVFDKRILSLGLPTVLMWFAIRTVQACSEVVAQSNKQQLSYKIRAMAMCYVMLTKHIQQCYLHDLCDINCVIKYSTERGTIHTY